MRKTPQSRVSSYGTRTDLAPGRPWSRCYCLPMPSAIGIWELLILLLVLLLVFGPKRLPQMGRQLCKGIRDFNDSVTGDWNDDEVAATSLPPADPVMPAAPAAPVVPDPRQRDYVS